VRGGRGRSRVSALTGSWSPELATLPKGKLDRLAARQVPTRNLHLIAFVHAPLDPAQGRESCGATEVNWHRLAPRRQSLRCVHSASADAGAAGWGTLATRLREGKYSDAPLNVPEDPRRSASNWRGAVVDVAVCGGAG
jgi:hypothetical protein